MPVATALDAVDLDRYPIDDLDAPAGRDLVAHCRTELDRQGACDLPGFLRPEAVAAILEGVAPRRAGAFRTATTHDITFSGAEPDPADPYRTPVRSAKALIAADEIAADDPLRAVYEHDALTAFVAGALEAAPLHRSSDPLGALNVMVYETGDELGWHFDNADFVVTLMLQAADRGGTFEYAPGLRTATDDNRAGVAALLAGDRSAVRTLSPQPGTLALFRGRRSAHRVTPVEGDVPRINAVLGFGADPDARLSASARRIFYGR